MLHPMQTNTSTEASSLTGAPSGDDDPRAVFARAVALGTAVIDAVRPDQLDQPTPCSEYDVRHLLGHLLTVLERVAVMGRGDDPFVVPMVTDGVADDAWLSAWLAAAHEVQAAWTDDATLDQTIRLPWAVLSGRATLASYTNEVTVHVWDLARATGQQPAWDDQVLEVAFDSIRQILPAGDRTAQFQAAIQNMPPEVRPTAPPFGEAVAVPAGAPLIDRLVAWNGRTP